MSKLELSKIVEKTSEIIKNCEVGYMAIIDEQGYPKAATRSNFKPDGISGGYFSSGMSGNLIQSILAESKSSVCYHSGADNVTLIGKSEIITDEKIKEDLWVDWFIDHYPGGSKDPEYGIIKFTTERVSLWVDHEVYVFNLSDH